MFVDVLVPVMRDSAHNNMMSRNFFVLARLVQQNYEKVMTLKAIWWWRVGNEREIDIQKIS